MQSGWSEAESVNRITPDMVKTCRPFYECLPKINYLFLQSRAVFAYNYDFDATLLVEQGVNLIPNCGVDVMLDFADDYQEFDGYHDEPTWQSLRTAADTVGYRMEKAHDSLEDCRATLAVAKWLMAKQGVAE